MRVKIEILNKLASTRIITLLKNICLVFSLIFALNFFLPYQTFGNRNHYSLPINRISGFVFDEKRNPIPKVFVELQDELNRTLTTVRTDSTGRYVFTGMSQGTFFIRAIPTGTNLSEQTIRVRVVNLGPPGGNFGQSDDVNQDFYLRPRKGNSDTPLYQVGVIFAQNIPELAENAYKKAVIQINNENYPEAIKFLEEALIIFPKYFIALNRLGYLYFEQKSYIKASEYFAIAADVNPKSEPTIYLLAYSVFLTKRFDATITILQGALGQKHKTSRIYLLFGKAFRIKKNFEDAETSLKLAESLNNSKNPEVHWELAKLYGENLKKYTEAAKQLKLFLKLQPNSEDKEKIEKLILKLKEKATKTDKNTKR